MTDVKEYRRRVDELEREVERLRVREEHAIEYERRIVWDTTCGTCATTLDNAYAETCRAEIAEAKVARILEVLDHTGYHPSKDALYAALGDSTA